jgi:flagellar M-ring protein FliF
VRVTRNATGMIKRVNAAVVVNYRTATDAKGKTSTNAPTQEELDKLTALVQEAVGYDKNRGDSVRVVAAPSRRRPSPPKRPCRCGSSPGCATCCAPPPCRAR